jgi:hypothetical protein
MVHTWVVSSSINPASTPKHRLPLRIVPWQTELEVLVEALAKERSIWSEVVCSGSPSMYTRRASSTFSSDIGPQYP